VLEQIAEMFNEIAAEMGTEVLHAPMRLVAEAFQFAILIAIVWAVAAGFGKRKGFVVNMLAERRDRVAARLESASLADASLAESKRQATAATRAGRARAREIIASAKAECVQLEQAARAETDADCKRIEERAEAALSTEQQEMMLELREQLVELVSSATRSIMNEKLTVAEQRTLIENSIMGSLSSSAASNARVEALAAEPTPKGA